MHLSLRAGEKIYLNGAVIRVDRKVSIELLNDVTFLLEAHVMQPKDTTTPLRQLYFIVQTMLIDPAAAERAHEMFQVSVERMIAAYSNAQIIAGLKSARTLVGQGRRFEALRTLRNLFSIEDGVMRSDVAKPRDEAA